MDDWFVKGRIGVTGLALVLVPNWLWHGIPIFSVHASSNPQKFELHERASK